MDKIIVIDFGSQYTHLIVKKVRKLGVYAEIVLPENYQIKDEIKGIIFSGSPYSVYEENAPKIDKNILSYNIPILGICYGCQLLAYILGGKVNEGSSREYGIAYLNIDVDDKIFNNLSNNEQVWMSHKDYVLQLPQDCIVLAHTSNSPIAVFKHKEKPFYGVQFHPEVYHTKNGDIFFHNFLFNICHCKKNWKMEDIILSAIDEIKSNVGNSKAIVALSGGIDSSVTCALASKAIGNNLFAVFVDHGFMRENESYEIEKEFKKYPINFIKINAKKEFLKAIKGVVNPESKRKIIGKKFIRIFERYAKLVNAEYLLQGTIYPDRIESGYRKFSDKIKTHHNVGGLPLRIKFKKIIEPLKDFYKDEVREIGKLIGLSDKIISRQPFPGPGLAIRIIGEVTQKKLNILRKANKIVDEEVQNSKLQSLWQIFPVLLNTRTTGVKGDRRAYGYTIAIRAVESVEGMTANFAKLPYDLLEKISTRITNEINEVNRVVYDITNKPPATIEWE